MRFTRIIIFVFIIFLLIKPRWVFNRHIPPSSVVLLDDSPSMQLWKNVPDFKKIISSLHIKHRVLKISSFNKENTYLGKALNYASKHFPDVSFILLLSDGINSGGSDPVYVADKENIPIFVYTFRDSFKDNLIRSIYGEREIFEGDTLHLEVQTAGGDSVILRGKKRWVRKLTGNKVIFSVVPDTGITLYKVYLYPMDKIPENNQGTFSCKVSRKHRIYIVCSQPNMDFKYTMRMFELPENIVKGYIRRKSGFFNIDKLRMQNIDIRNMDLLVVFNPDNKIENLVKSALNYGKEVLYFPEQLSYAPYLPFLPGAREHQKLFLSDTVPPVEYLKPSGMLPGAKGLLSIKGKFLFAEMRYKKAKIIESAFKGLWRLGLREGVEYLKDKFGVINTDKNIVHLIYPYIVSSGEEMKIIVRGRYNNGWIEFMNKKEILRRCPGDTLETNINTPVKGGKYTFNLFLRDSLYGEYPFYVNDISEEFRLNHSDTVLLQSIAEVSGGKLIHNIKEIPIFKEKERRIYFDAVHNPFILGFLILLLGIDWYMWKRNRMMKK